VQYLPKVALSDLVESLKGVSARALRHDLAATITNAALGGRFWSPSHFARSRGGPPLATVKEYIDNQKQPDSQGLPARPTGQGLRPRTSMSMGELVGLRADCERCFGLCCVAPAFSASADFAIRKPAGQACPNLQPAFRCGIHTRLRQQGFRGCTVYDCFGAGQKVSQVTFGGQDWRRAPGSAKQMFRVFPIVRDLHELAWYLSEARTLPAARGLRGALSRALHKTEHLAGLGPDALVELDVAAHRGRVNDLLLGASELVRADVPHKLDYRGADLIGADLHGQDLRGASLRGAYLIEADLRAADLSTADVIGADLRGADISGADLSGSIFLIQSQIDSARGDSSTTLPASLTYPAHW
jgi:uncharacterized protein YjbI with pentapeptide repeats